MAMSAEHRSKFAALHQQWCRLHMSEKIPKQNPKQTNKQKQDFQRVRSVPTENRILISCMLGRRSTTRPP